ncbi:MAG: hypothetical protein HZA14_00285 [Nitrospirae bacterium]|nr:hypothetical protein [Nitrospirota bacterium]
MNVTNEKKRNKTFCLLSLLFCCLTLFTYGCKSAPIKQYARPNVDISKINKIAVLPFENFTPSAYAADKIRSLVIIDLLSRGTDVIEPGEIIRTMEELRVRSVHSVSVFDLKHIGETLKVDALMMGSVGAFEISKGISVQYPEVSINLRLFDVKSGNIIWSVWHTAGGADFWTRHFGAEGPTLDETSKKVIKEAIDALFIHKSS